MPLTIRTSAMKYKNPQTGEYEDFNAAYTGDIADAVDDWLDAHPEATTTVEDGAVSYAKLDANLQNKVTMINALDEAVDELTPAVSTLETTTGNLGDAVSTLETTTGNLGDAVSALETTTGNLGDAVSALQTTTAAMSAARVNALSTRWHVDCVNGDDNDTGAAGHAWRTLDKFFSMANRLDGGRADIRCYLDTPGTYDVGASDEQIKSFTGIAVHITGSTAADPEYDGNYIVRFLSQNTPKFYACHINFKNLKIQCPNTTDFAVDGGNASITNCYFDTQLSIYTTPTSIDSTTAINILISGGSVNATNVKTLLTTGAQWTIAKNATVLYGGSIANNGLIANSTYAAFSVSASTLMPLQVYPTTLGPSINANNAFIIGTSARLTTWQAMQGTVNNSVWITG